MYLHSCESINNTTLYFSYLTIRNLNINPTPCVFSHCETSENIFVFRLFATDENYFQNDCMYLKNWEKKEHFYVFLKFYLTNRKNEKYSTFWNKQ
jgi:hypothetical protein